MMDENRGLDSIDRVPIWHKKRVLLKYIDEDQMELFYAILKTIAEENGIKVEDGEADYVIGLDY
tara:strand:- start:6074 stop:6265 length:192 start_codon:yes stop_codon:yes gene_type:complete